MTDVVPKEINRGYLGFIRSISSDPEGAKKRNALRCFAFFVHSIANVAKLSLIPVLFLYGVCLILWIRFRLRRMQRQETSPSHQEALHYVPEFVSQYPMHLYPIVAKALEMAFIKRDFESIAGRLKGGMVELAIGDGTFSSRILSGGSSIIGFDLNPYSLVQTKKYPHVTRRIVADCLTPPIEEGGASLIMSNNFLHHITDKKGTLEQWSSIARYALFNENTNYWAEGWFRPYVLKSLGLRKAARKAADRIAHRSLQTLWRKGELETLVKRFYEIHREESFFHEKVFFLCSVCSALLFCYGPPTPPLQKKVMNGILAPLTRRMTGHMARALIQYDAVLPRDRDVFICWAVESRKLTQTNPGDHIRLVCPDCHERLLGNQCRHCQRSFEEKEGMLFLLPKKLAEEFSFREERAGLLGEEHL